jgi:hypothetical protein
MTIITLPHEPTSSLEGPDGLRARGFFPARTSQARHGRAPKPAGRTLLVVLCRSYYVVLQRDACGMQVAPWLTQHPPTRGPAAIECLPKKRGPWLLPEFPGECFQSPLPVVKCSAKPTVFGVVTDPNRIHSGVSLGQQTERKRLFHQNMTRRSRYGIVGSPNLGFLGHEDRSNARTEVQEPNFLEFGSVRRDVNVLALLPPVRRLC